MFDRRWTRLPQFDYSTNGVYFITICTRQREKLLSSIVGRGLDPSLQAELILTPYGAIAEKDLLQIPEHFTDVQILNYVIMPDHLHVLFSLGCQKTAVEGSKPLPTVPIIIGQYKASVSRKCKRPIWPNYSDFEEIWQYIDNNPLQWVLDGKA